jgi:hypothetical protein
MIEGDECIFQQHKNDPRKVMNLTKEEWDQSDLRLANYTQKSNQMLS